MKAKVFFALAALFPLCGFAGETVRFPWDEEKGYALTFYNGQGEKDYRIITSVDFGDNGLKRVYFDLDYYNFKDDAESKEDLCVPGKGASAGVMTINGQAIKVFKWCKRYKDKASYIQVTPETPKGLAFVVDQLSRSPKMVDVSIEGVSFDVSAVGFSSVWNKSSDIAL